MPPFPKPSFAYDYDPAAQIAALWDYRKNKPGRRIPKKTSKTLLVATWNIANLGVQDRLDSDYALIAEMVTWFDLVAVQEVNDNLRGIDAIHEELPSRYDLLFSDASGNQERQAFLYDSRKISRLREVGRVSIPPSDLPRIRRSDSATTFRGFDRGPYLASFESGSFRFGLLNVHLFYGSKKAADVNRRVLETFAVAWWADRTHRDAFSYVDDVVPLGDFNLPKAQAGDRIFDALVSLGLQLPPHTSQIGSAIASDNHYDQLAFFPGGAQTRFTGACNVFDFDGALFQDLWNDPKRTPKQFLEYARFHLSDHRPLWAEFHTT
ncbi:MAG TPA: endonuclease/exonuclease/phosphatase family protein [Gaiellaceae bacterium]|jgi:endonuclease/exonuclease/phosphatase family metal-dependent hydrolase|nr:endonuclease/exonuclease/phosphatase family protein [Gaiellaceae bacterium]